MEVDSKAEALELIRLSVARISTSFGTYKTLSECDPNAVDFIWQAANVLFHAAAQSIARHPRWSIAELQLSEEDYAILRQWGESGDIKMAMVSSRWEGPTGYPARLAFGLLFIVYCAEIARRETNEGELWSVIQGSLGYKLRRATFLNNQPNEKTKEVIQLVARKLNMRHVFGIEGGQAWMKTLFLQFGITKKGLKRLPWWLGSYEEPIAVHELLEKNSLNYSQSFAELWYSLKEFRWDSKELNETRHLLLTNPWTPPEN